MSHDHQTEHDQEISDNRNLSKIEPPPQGRGPGGDERTHGDVPSMHEIMERLNLLPGLVAIGALTPAKANSMRAVYHTMLSHMGDGTAAAAAGLTDDDVLKVMRDSPDVLKLLRRFLTTEQVALIIREAPGN